MHASATSRCCRARLRTRKPSCSRDLALTLWTMKSGAGSGSALSPVASLVRRPSSGSALVLTITTLFEVRFWVRHCRAAYQGPRPLCGESSLKADRPLAAMCGRLSVGKGFRAFGRAGRCGHVFGLLVRRAWPLAILPPRGRVPDNSTRSRRSGRLGFPALRFDRLVGLRSCRPSQARRRGSPDLYAACSCGSR